VKNDFGSLNTVAEGILSNGVVGVKLPWGGPEF
jgi:hypothetical protein